MARSRAKKADDFAALRKRLLERLPPDDIMTTILGYEGEPKEGHSFNDRSSTLVVCAILEQFLETALSSHFEVSEDDAKQIFVEDKGGPLSSLANKITMGYALGLYGPQMRSDLQIIRRIRNAFAHSKVNFDFETK